MILNKQIILLCNLKSFIRFLSLIFLLNLLTVNAQSYSRLYKQNYLGHKIQSNLSDTLNIYWDEDFFSPGLKEINVIETNGDQVYIGGRFIKNVDGDTVNSIVLWDRLIDLYLPLGKGVFFDDGSSGVINSIKSTDNDVYIGGIFTKVLNLDNGEIPVSGIAKWNGTEWESLNIILDGSVNSIEVTNSHLIIGGDFNTLTPYSGNSITVNGIAIYNFSANEWSPLGNGLSQSEGAFGKRINSIKATNNGFYVGGYFDKALNSDETIIDANNISFFSLNEMKWSKLGEGISEKYDNNSFFEYVNDIEVNDRRIYVGGNFKKAGTKTVNNITYWDTLDAEWKAMENGLDGEVTSLAMTGNINLFITGKFIEGSGKTFNYIAKWNPVLKWAELDDGKNNIGTDGYTLAISSTDNNEVIVGGLFEYTGNLYSNGLSIWTGIKWLPTLGLGVEKIGGYINAAVTDGDYLYIGGKFSNVGGKEAWNIARYDINDRTWESIGEYGTDGEVFGLSIDDNKLYVSGNFEGAYNSNNDFVSSKDIIRWNITIGYWQKVGDGTGVQGGDAHVYTIKAINGSIVIGGHFTEVGGTEAYAVAKWDGLSWEALDGPNSSDVPGVNGAVFAIEIVGNNIYVGGSFFNADNVPVANIAVWDGNDWSGLGNGLNNIVYALTSKSNVIYAGGEFTEAYGNPNIIVNHVASWNGQSWSPIGDGFQDPSGTGLPVVRTITTFGAELLAAGRFEFQNSNTTNNIAKWDGSNWVGLGSGITNSKFPYPFGLYKSTINTIATHPDFVFIGGYFDKAGDFDSENIAQWWQGASKFELNLTVSPSSAINSVAITPNPGKHIIKKDSTISVSVINEDGWVFDGWTLDAKSDANSINVIMNQNKTIVANFKKISLTGITNYQQFEGVYNRILKDERVADGNIVKFTVTVNNPTKKDLPVQLKFYKDGVILHNTVGDSLVNKNLPLHSSAKVEFSIDTKKYSWTENGSPVIAPIPIKVILFYNSQLSDSMRTYLRVKPKPVILVHGLWSNAATWKSYTNETINFLKTNNVYWKGYAISSMSTGSLSFGKLFSSVTISQNAKKLSFFIDITKGKEQADHVDIVAHSMGGLISRYYIHKLMEKNNTVDNLVMLGTPNKGSPCTTLILKAAIKNGYTLGAAVLAGGLTIPINLIQLTPDYVTYIFNNAITDQKEVNFHILRGMIAPITCNSSIPGDGVVDIFSAYGTLTASLLFDNKRQKTIFHTSMSKDEITFNTFVRPILDYSKNIPLKKAPFDTTLPLQDCCEENQTILADVYEIPPNASYHKSFEVYIADTLNITLLAGAELSSQVYNPQNQLVSEYIAGSDSANSFFRNILLPNPQAGQWKITFQNTSSDTTIASMDVSIKGNPFSFKLETEEVNASGVQVTATVSNNGAPVNSANVEIRLINFTAVEDTLSIYDDGNHDDGLANDGIYSTTIDSLADGYYSLIGSASYNGEVRYNSQNIIIGDDPGLSGVDLSIGALIKTDSLGIGDELFYDTVVKNFGDAAATNTALTVDVPEDFTVTTISFDCDTCYVQDNSIICTQENISSNESYYVKFSGMFAFEGIKNISFHIVSNEVDIDITDNTYAQQIKVGNVTSIKDENFIPKEYRLYQNYPNPFNPVTTIIYDIKENSHVNLKVYNILGQEIKTLVNKRQNAGNYKIDFNGNGLASGVYIYRLSVRSSSGLNIIFDRANKMILLQ